jgi:hypothetical protein
MFVYIDFGSKQSAIHIKVPDSELEVLRVLRILKEAHAPAIARASGGSISVAAVYKLLGRLEDRGLVLKRTEYVPAGDIMAKRVIYKIHEAVCFKEKRNVYENSTEASSGRNVNSTMREVTHN